MNIFIVRVSFILTFLREKREKGLAYGMTSCFDHLNLFCTIVHFEVFFFLLKNEMSEVQPMKRFHMKPINMMVHLHNVSIFSTSWHFLRSFLHQVCQVGAISLGPEAKQYRYKGLSVPPPIPSPDQRKRLCI